MSGMEGPAIALLAASAASTGTGLFASRQQAKLDVASVNFEAESAKNEAAQQSFASAQGFRQALSSQLAISALRGGGGSIALQFASKSLAAMSGDAAVFERQQKTIDINKGLGISNAKSGRFGRDASAITSLLKSGIDSVNFSSGA